MKLLGYFWFFFHIKQASECPVLSQLELFPRLIGLCARGEGIEDIGALDQAEDLQELDLQGNYISDISPDSMYYVYDFVLYAIPVLIEALGGSGGGSSSGSGGGGSGGGGGSQSQLASSVSSRLGTDDNNAIRACASSQIKESRLVIEDCGRTFKFYFE